MKCPKCKASLENRRVYVEDENEMVYNGDYWVCPKCKCKSAHKPKDGRCPVCGTPMKEIPMGSDTDETGPGESGR